MEGGDIGVEVMGQELAVARLITDEDLGLEGGIAPDAGEDRGRDDIDVGEEDVAVEAPGGAHGAGDRAPEHGVGDDVPQGPGAGLNLKAGVVVVLELGAEGEGEMVGYDAEGVLQEAAVDVVGLLVGFEVDGGEGLDEVAGADADARAPDEVLREGAWRGG